MAEVLTLRAFLASWAAEEFRYGSWDCAMPLATWVRSRTGRDPAAHLRGHYATEIAYKRLLVRAGGLVALVEEIALAAGLSRNVLPSPGDVGVIEIPGVGQVGAIRAPGGWAFKLSRRLSCGELPHLGCWGAECLRP